MKPTFAATMLFAFVAVPAAAQDQPVCMAAPDLKASLIDWYQERPAAGEKDKKEQLWVSGRSGTWSVVRFMADGNACVMAQGSDWEAGLARDELLAALDN